MENSSKSECEPEGVTGTSGAEPIEGEAPLVPVTLYVSHRILLLFSVLLILLDEPSGAGILPDPPAMRRRWSLRG